MQGDLGDIDQVGVEEVGARVEPRDLEQVVDQILEAADVGVEEIERALGAVIERSRRVRNTSIDADNVINGERSSWLTSEAKRASRSMRSSRAAAISLNDIVSGARSGSSATTSRVSRRPLAIEWAASLTSVSGSSARRLAEYPRPAPAAVVNKAPPAKMMPSERSVSDSSVSDTISK